MGACQGVAQHGKAARCPAGRLPLSQRLLREVAGHRTKAVQPPLDARLAAVPDRHEQRPPGPDKERDGRGATGLETGRAGQVEAVEPRQCGGDRLRILDLVGNFFGVLLLQLVIQRLKPRRHAEEGRKTVQDGDVGHVFVVDPERGLSRNLQCMQKRDLEGLQAGDMGLELGPVEERLGAAQLFRVGQLPLAGGLRDLPADIAFDRIARQDDLGTGAVGHHRIEDARVVVVEITEARQSRCLVAHAGKKTKGIRIAVGQGQAEQVGLVLLADEMGVERLAVAGDAGQGVQVRLKEIGPCPHFGEHHEAAENGHAFISPERAGPAGGLSAVNLRQPGNRPSARAACPGCAGSAGTGHSP